MIQSVWKNLTGLIPAEHLWCDFKCRPWAKNSNQTPMTCGYSHFIHFKTVVIGVTLVFGDEFLATNSGLLNGWINEWMTLAHTSVLFCSVYNFWFTCKEQCESEPHQTKNKSTLYLVRTKASELLDFPSVNTPEDSYDDAYQWEPEFFCWMQAVSLPPHRILHQAGQRLRKKQKIISIIRKNNAWQEHLSKACFCNSTTYVTL